MPGSPRPQAQEREDDGVYRSIFQQPLVEIPPAVPSYAWFEFLLHPEALQQHVRWGSTRRMRGLVLIRCLCLPQLETLRSQQASGEHSATSAIELVREFLDQAQVVADEGNVRNSRYKALLLVAAQVALQMQLPLTTIEQSLPLHFQRLLVDGIVDFAEGGPVAAHSEFTKNVALAPYEAHVLHNRWTLRAMVHQSQNRYLTSSNKNDAEDLAATFQSALGDLKNSHTQVAQNVEAILMNQDAQKLTRQTQLDTFYDLGEYFFCFGRYEKAYEDFSRALELIEDHPDVEFQDKATLEGYLAACEAVLESRSISDGSASPKSTEAQLDAAWELRDWEQVVSMLQADVVAYESTRLPPGFRMRLEQQALRLVRMARGSERNDVELTKLRFLYKRVALGNAVTKYLRTPEQDGLIALEGCLCTCFRLLHEEVFHASAPGTQGRDEVEKTSSLFADLVQFVLRLAAFVYAKEDKLQQQRLQIVLARLVSNFTSISSLDGAVDILRECNVPVGQAAQSVAQKEEELASLESHLRNSTERQRSHCRLASDLNGLFVFASPAEKDQFIAAFRQEMRDAVENGNNANSILTDDQANARGRWKNLVSFCMANNCWDMLTQWRAVTSAGTVLQRQLDFVLACGSLMHVLSSVRSASSKSSQGDFSILASNKVMADVVLKRRELVAAIGSPESKNADDEQEETVDILVDLPLWVLETLVCMSAGLLHRAFMRNICDYRISFDLTPYGDLALLQAFAPEHAAKKKPVEGDMQSEDALKEAAESSEYMTGTFLKNVQADLVTLHTEGLGCLFQRCAREPRWHCAKADLSLNPVIKQKLSSAPGKLKALL